MPTIKRRDRESIMDITLHRVGDKLRWRAGESLCLETLTTYKTKNTWSDAFSQKPGKY